MELFRFGNIHVDGLLEHIDKLIVLAFYPVDVDGDHAVWNGILPYAELNILNQKRLFCRCH